MADSKQINAVMRHVMTAGATVFTLMGAVALIPADQVKEATDALQRIGNGLQEVIGGVSTLWVIIGPVVVGIAMRGAGIAASFRSHLKSVTDAAEQEPDKKAALAAATANVSGVVEVKTTADIARATADPKVVSAS